MANPTTNYGFVLPTSSDLVTDLPADFDVALQGVDTQLKALNPSTTLGDIEYRSSTANTNTRLPIGTTGQVLTVSGGVPTWTTPSSGSFTLISTTSLTGSSVTLSSIPSSYKYLYLFITNWYPSTNASKLYLKLNSDGSALYDQAAHQVNANLENTNQTQINLTFYGASNSASDYTKNHTWIRIPNYADSTVLKLVEYQTTYKTGEATPRAMMEGGWWDWRSATAVSSLNFTTSSGNHGGGTITLYGAN